MYILQNHKYRPPKFNPPKNKVWAEPYDQPLNISKTGMNMPIAIR